MVAAIAWPRRRNPSTTSAGTSGSTESSSGSHWWWIPEALSVEPDVPADVVDGLRRRGHQIDWTTEAKSVQAVRVLPDGTMQAASDPRKDGAPAAPR